MDAAAARMEQYRVQVKEIDNDSKHLLHAMSIDGPALLGSITTEIGDSQQAFEAAVGQAGSC